MEIKKLLGDNIIIEPESVERVNEHGLEIPDSGQNESNTGFIRVMGEGRKIIGEHRRHPFYVNLGDRVIYNSFAGETIGFDGNDNCRMLAEEDILAVLED